MSVLQRVLYGLELLFPAVHSGIFQVYLKAAQPVQDLADTELLPDLSRDEAYYVRAVPAILPHELRQQGKGMVAHGTEQAFYRDLIYPAQRYQFPGVFRVPDQVAAPAAHGAAGRLRQFSAG